MQRNYTPQGKPQDPGAIDRRLHAAALVDLQALAPKLSAYAQHLTELNGLVVAALREPGHTGLASLVHEVRRALRG